MSIQLTFGGAPVQMVRDKGTPNSVTGFRTQTITQGPNLTVGLPTTFIFQLAENSIQYRLVTALRNEWFKIAGIWKQGYRFYKVAGVWNPSIIWVKIGGVWKK